jgi:methylmalonyl-CoA mutase
MQQENVRGFGKNRVPMDSSKTSFMTALSEIEKELQATFPAHSYEAWKAAAEELLKGKPFEKVLVTPTYEGFDLQPIFRKDDLAALTFSQDLPGAGSFVRGGKATGYFGHRWKISQELPYGTAQECNAALLREIKGGANEAHILLDPASMKGLDPEEAVVGEVAGCGLSLATVEDLETALKGIDLKHISLFIESGASALPVARLLKGYCQKQGIAFETIQGNLGSDPLGAWARNGSLPVALDQAMSETATLIRELDGSSLGALYVDGNLYHNAGASAVQELGFTLAAANAYLQSMDAQGLTATQVAHSLRIGLGVGSHYFLEIAKLRAVRMLWAKVLQSWGADFDSLPLHVHARTSTWNKTAIDPYVNMLRVTSEAFAAVIGGSDSMHVGPFDEVVRLPDEFSSRIARNVHFILAEECELTRVIDPAGGSYYVEWLTDQVARKAWEWFQKVEAEGGFVEAVRKGFIQEAIAKVAAQRIANVEKRRDIIVGTNQYPNAKEQPLEARLPDYPALHAARSKAVKAVRDANQCTIGKIATTLRGTNTTPSESINPVPTLRVSESIEKLRSASFAYGLKNGHAPRVFQANWGASRSYRLRADWTSAFFQVAGLEVLNETDFDQVDAMVEALTSSGAGVAVITSNDDNYATHTTALAAAIKAAHPSVYLLLAGAPGEQEAAWKAAGIDDFVNVRTNNYAMLAMLLKKTGVLA